MVVDSRLFTCMCFRHEGYIDWAIVFVVSARRGINRPTNATTKSNIAESSPCGSGVIKIRGFLIAILVTIGTVSSIDFVPYVYWSYAGLCVAVIRVGYSERSVVLSRRSEVIA